MARFDVLKIVRPIRLSEYAEGYGESVIHVWVNPPAPLLQEHDQLVREAEQIKARFAPTDKPSGEEELKAFVARLGEIGTAHLEWYARIWSQGPEGTHWTAEDIGKLVDSFVETDPYLWKWLSELTIDMIRQHRSGQKKG